MNFKINWDKIKLIPVIVQDVDTDEVLMLAYMNEEAFKKTLKSGFATTTQEADKSFGKRVRQVETLKR